MLKTPISCTSLAVRGGSRAGLHRCMRGAFGGHERPLMLIGYHVESRICALLIRPSLALEPSVHAIVAAEELRTSIPLAQPKRIGLYYMFKSGLAGSMRWSRDSIVYCSKIGIPHGRWIRHWWAQREVGNVKILETRVNGGARELPGAMPVRRAKGRAGISQKGRSWPFAASRLPSAPGAAATPKAGQLHESLARPFSTGKAARTASAGCSHQKCTLSALAEHVRVSHHLRKDGVKSP